MAALAWQAERDEQCPGCGLPLDETTELDANGNTLRWYEAVTHVCGACQTRENAQKGATGDTAGVLWSTIRKG